MDMVIRPYEPEDLKNLVGLINKANQADSLGLETSVEEMEGLHQRPGCSPQQNYLMAEVNGRLVGYVDLWMPNDKRLICVRGVVDPDFRRQGIAAQLFAQACLRARQVAARQIELPVQQKVEPAHHFANKMGCQINRYFWQMRLDPLAPLPAACWSSGVSVRAYVPTLDDQVLIEIERLCFSNCWEGDILTSEIIRNCFENGRWLQHGSFFAQQGQEIIGFIITGQRPRKTAEGYERYGEIFEVGVHPNYRRRGIGRALLQHGLNFLYDVSFRTVELSVESDNAQAKRLYAEIGFVEVDCTVWYRKEVQAEK